MKDNEVKIIFENNAQAKYFMEWLSNSGEQDYFDAVDLTGSDGVEELFYNPTKQEIIGKKIKN